ncbi:sulfotransferase family protein [Nitrincola sp.]|uniref:sulfotransferase family protein n=1 Tax=Oceanospirillales TaxID=135619 RepID=UPI003A8E3864
MSKTLERKDPFFILGNPRSGTSLLRLMLNSHPETVVPPECGFLLWLSEKYAYLPDYNQNTYANFIDDLFKTKKIETWDIKKEKLLTIIKTERPKDYRSMTSIVYSYYAIEKGKKPRIHGDKNNYYINEIEKIEKVFPNSKIIYIVRDGRDVAASYFKIDDSKIYSKYKPALPQSIEKIASDWSKSTLMAKSMQNHSNTCVVLYENLVRDPTRALSEVCAHLDIDYSDNMLQFYKNNDEPIDFLQWKAKTKQPVDTSSLGSYKKELTQEQILTFEQHARSALEAFNYI